MYFFLYGNLKDGDSMAIPGVEILYLLLVLFSNCAILPTLIMFTFELFGNILLQVGNG